MNKLGLYIHIPFCVRKCLYCDFYSLPGASDRHTAYIDKVCGQMEALSALCVDRTVDSIYIGGGTPSIPDARLISRLADCLKRCFALSERTEWTIEANPATVNASKLAAYLACGINRISFGVQSYQNETLRRIGRLHTFEEALESVGLARSAGFENISVDLMYALPGQDGNEIENAFRALLPLGICHISLYGLKIEENTPFGRDSSLRLPDEEKQAQTYLRAVQLFEDNGFRQYEISNFALPGRESRHNLRYWNREEYLGFGPAAHSFFNGTRFAVGRSLDAYLSSDDFSLSSDLYTDRQKIGKDEAFTEELMLSLRLTTGFPLEKLLSRTAKKEEAESYLLLLEKNGYLRFRAGNFFLTPRGMLVSNTVISDLMAMI